MTTPVDPPAMGTPPPADASPDLRRLRRQVEDLERALEAIRSGDVDALVVGGGGDVQLYHRITTDRPYLLLVEEMAAGLATISTDGCILFANQRLAEWLRCERGALVGQPLQDLVLAPDQPAVAQWLAEAAGGTRPRPLALRRRDGIALPVVAALGAVEIEAEPMLCLVLITDSGAGALDEPHHPHRGARREQAWDSLQPDPNPDPTVRRRQALVLTFGCLLLLFAVDLLLPQPEFLLLYWIPLVVTASFARPRQLQVVALTILVMGIVSGLRWGMLADPDYWFHIVGLALVTPACLVVAARRCRDEDRLRESQARYRTLAENAADVVFRASLEGVTEWISPAVRPLLGWMPEQLIGRPFGPFVHPGDLPALHRADAAFARGERRQFRLRVARAQGGYRWVEVLARGAIDASGAVRGIVGSWRDIQAEVEAEQADAYDRARLAATVDSLLDPHVVLRARRDAAGTIVDFTYVEANQAACRYNLISHEQLIGRSLLGFLPAHSATGLLAMYSRVLDTGEPLVLDDFVYPHEILGEERHYDIRAVPMGEELSYTWRDVTERVEAQQRLAASEESYRLLAQNSTDVVLRIRDDHFQRISPSITTALGWQPEELIGRGATDQLHPDDQAGYAADLQAIQRGESVVSRQRVLDKEGTWHWTEAHAGPYWDQQGRIDGLVASFRVIDSQVAAEQQLERLARTDELTGLLNRREVLERIAGRGQHQLRSGEHTAVLFCDLDRFKAINDGFGHAAGDEMLRVMAQRIRGCLRSDDLAARVGGDELLVVLQGVQSLENAVAIAEEIRLAALEPVPTKAGDLQISLSIGVTLALPGETTDSLIARADAAMYDAKQIGRNRVIPIEA